MQSPAGTTLVSILLLLEYRTVVEVDLRMIHYHRAYSELGVAHPSCQEIEGSWRLWGFVGRVFAIRRTESQGRGMEIVPGYMGKLSSQRSLAKK